MFVRFRVPWTSRLTECRPWGGESDLSYWLRRSHSTAPCDRTGSSTTVGRKCQPLQAWISTLVQARTTGSYWDLRASRIPGLTNSAVRRFGAVAEQLPTALRLCLVRPMSQVDPLVCMLDLTNQLLERAGELSDEHYGGFASGSPAAELCDDSELGSALLDAYFTGSAQIAAAMDFTAAMVHLCRPEIHRYAVFACARAAIEASSRAWWILDERLTPQERAMRGLKERCRGLRERQRLEKAMDQSGIPAQRRMVKVRKRARRLGATGKLGLPPDMSDLFPKAFRAAGLSVDEGEFAMKQLSAYVHVAPSALLAQTRVAEKQESALGDPRTTLHTPSISYSELAYTIDSVAQVFSLAFASQMVAFGWNEDQWMEVWRSVKTGLRTATIHILSTEE